MKTQVEQTAIYWGAFNPPTLAHAQVVNEVLKTSHISRIIISPSWEREDKDFRIAYEHRRIMIEKYIEILQRSWLNVSLDDYFFEGKNKWITTTRAEEEYFRSKLWDSPFFIFGSDVAKNIPDWSNNQWRFIEERLRKIFISRPWYNFDFKWNWFGNYMLLDIPDMLDVSSSIAREMLSNKRSVAWVLHPEITEQIKTLNLYS
jgi:nicotinate (nicotinamide) nucleotide adenylyltransferase